MPWTAKIRPIQAAPVFNDTINLDVEYSDGTNTFVKQYNLHAQHFQDVAAVDDLIERELQNLTKFDDVKEKLVANVDRVIEMKALKKDVIKGDAVKPQIDNSVIRG